MRARKDGQFRRSDNSTQKITAKIVVKKPARTEGREGPRKPCLLRCRCFTVHRVRQNTGGAPFLLLPPRHLRRLTRAKIVRHVSLVFSLAFAFQNIKYSRCGPRRSHASHNSLWRGGGRGEEKSVPDLNLFKSVHLALQGW